MANLIRTCKWCGDRYYDNSIVSSMPTWLSPIRSILNLIGVISNRYKYCSTRCYYHDPRNASKQVSEVKESRETPKSKDTNSLNKTSRANQEPIVNLDIHRNQINQLKQLKQLLDEGVLTKNEFEHQKSKILSAKK